MFPASLAQPTPNSFSAASDSQVYTSCASNVSNQSTSSIPNPQVSLDLPTASMAQLSTNLLSDHHALQSTRVPSPTSPSKYGLSCFTVLFTIYYSQTPLYRHLLNMDTSLLQIASLIAPGENPYILSKFNPLYMDTSLIRTLSMTHSMSEKEINKKID